MNVQNMTPKKLTVHSHLTAAQSQLEFPVQGPTVRAAANSAPRPSGLFPMGAIPYYTVYINMFKPPFKPQINWFIIIGGMPSLSLAHTNMIG